MSGILLSSARQDWRTPPWFLDLVRQVGIITLDPASAPDNPTGAAAFFARDVSIPIVGEWRGTCGLVGAWTRPGLAFVNPPYGGHLSGPVDPAYVHTKKCKTCKGSGDISTFAECGPCPRCEKGRIQTGIGRGWAQRIAQDPGEWLALVPTRTDTEWWQRLHEVCSWGLFWRSPEHGARINFVNPNTGEAKNGSTVPSTVFYHGDRVARFLGAFAPHGRIFPGYRTTLDMLGARS